MYMMPSKYMKVSYVWPKSAKKNFLSVKGVQKLKKIENFFVKKLNFFPIKTVVSIIYELCQHLGSLRSEDHSGRLQRPKPETECPSVQIRVKRACILFNSNICMFSFCLG